MVPSDVILLFASLLEKGISAGLVRANLSSNFCQVGDYRALGNGLNFLSSLCCGLHLLVGKNNQEWCDLRSLSQEKKIPKLKYIHLLSVRKKTKLGQLFSLSL